jgi:hypothetical protein
MDEEELEQIPWSTLITEHRDERRRMFLLAGGVAAALLVGFVGARLLTGDPAGTTIDLNAAAAPGTEPSTTTTSLPAAPTTVPSPPLSEADLMALLPDEQARAAVARAEWFVTDLFTSDLDPAGAAPIREAMSAGATLPVLPQESTAVAVAYVEWARAFRVEPVAPGLYRVGVVYRVLGATAEDDRFTRLTPRAVEVTVAVTPDGGTVVADLPNPIEHPEPPLLRAPVLGTAGAPEHVLGAALAATAGWAHDPRVESSGDASGLWRVVVSVADEFGIRWPLALWFDDAGTAVPPPGGDTASS